MPASRPPTLLVMFDFDGTLADSWSVAVHEVRQAALRFGYRQLTPEQFEELRGLPTRQIVDAFDVPVWRMPEIAAYLLRRLGEVAGDIPLFAGVPAMLRTLADAGVTMGVVSSNSADTVAKVLGADNLRYFAGLECGASLYGKDRRFLRLMKELGADKASSIAVGDESRDLDAAAKAGIVGLAVEWGYARPSLLRSLAPGRTFSTVDSLTAHLLESTDR